ncbi:MAG: DUF5683 domain-containing protein [Tannerellaceae bacterium]|jgi:hypothetical protein|nr:DUF5683 domain-containing protein [Tannerellaceae bacterium]
MRRVIIKTNSIILFAIWLLCFPLKGNTQEFIDEGFDTDTGIVAAPDSLIQAALSTADSGVVFIPEAPKAAFKPNPAKAILLGLIPGMGQVYNRKYWKLPLVYGGFMAFMYAITWNNKNYQDYWNGYKSIMHDAAAYKTALDAAEGGEVDFAFNKDWTEFYPGTDPKSAVFDSGRQNQLKSRKDYFRRYRDLSIILAVGFYGITLIDAYVDAQLFDFDISPELSMRIEPVFSPQTRYSSRNIGLNCSITF